MLTKADVEHCRVVLPRMAMEANLPEVVEATVLHVVSIPYHLLPLSMHPSWFCLASFALPCFTLPCLASLQLSLACLVVSCFSSTLGAKLGGVVHTHSVSCDCSQLRVCTCACAVSSMQMHSRLRDTCQSV